MWSKYELAKIAPLSDEARGDLSDPLQIGGPGTSENSSILAPA